LLTLWHRAGEAYGVPWQVLAAINKIESDFGRNMGPSSAGAVGWMQFMPDTWLRWGLDANADGLADPWNPDDAVFAAARYLAAAGAHDDLSRAVFAYNHAQWYVDEVLGLAADFGSGGAVDFTGSQAVFRLDQLQQQIAKARRAVARAREAVPRIERRVGASTDRQLRLELKAGDPKISTASFRELESRIAHLERGQATDRQRIEARQADVAAAIARLQSLKSELASASVAAPGGAESGSRSSWRAAPSTSTATSATWSQASSPVPRSPQAPLWDSWAPPATRPVPTCTSSSPRRFPIRRTSRGSSRSPASRSAGRTRRPPRPGGSRPGKRASSRSSGSLPRPLGAASWALPVRGLT